MAGISVLLRAIQEGVASLTWESETFAYAEGVDEESGRFRGLRSGRHGSVLMEGGSLLVKPEVARQHIPLKLGEEPGTYGVREEDDGEGRGEEVSLPLRFHGTVRLDPERIGRDAALIAEHVLQHLLALKDAQVEVRLEVDARISDGVPDHAVRTVTENARTLKFSEFGFERE